MAWRMISIYLCAIMVCVSGAAAEYEPSKMGSPYEALQKYNFPVGLLPRGAMSYRLDESTGEFRANLNGSCSFRLEEGYEVRYSPVIEGLISEGRLEKLRGVSVKVVLVWVNIVEVKRNEENLEFSVGFTSANFPVQNFQECPRCGCGLDCGNVVEEEEEKEDIWSSSLS